MLWGDGENNHAVSDNNSERNNCLSTQSFFWLLHPLILKSWLRHQMEILSALLTLCAGNSPVTGVLLSQRPVTRRFDVFFDLCLNKRLSKQWWCWWFETPACSLWRHCNVYKYSQLNYWYDSCNAAHTYRVYQIACIYGIPLHDIRPILLSH